MLDSCFAEAEPANRARVSRHRDRHRLLGGQVTSAAPSASVSTSADFARMLTSSIDGVNEVLAHASVDVVTLLTVFMI